MAHFERSLRSQFFLTGPRPCPYLPDRSERKLFTTLSGARAEAQHDDLSSMGFRRSQNIAYRPACRSCSACVSTRVRVSDFAPNRSQKRAIKRNADLARNWLDPEPGQEHFDLFKEYLAARHGDGGMIDMDAFDFAAMVEDSPVRTHLIEYRLPAENGAQGALAAACVTDVLRDGLSLVYSFFDTSLTARSLGRFMILDHVALAREAGLPFVYLGYWVKGSPKMDYKIEFQPSEILLDGGWTLYAPADDDASPSDSIED